ncbi:hypothetical protein G6038_18175 [Rhodococcus sp. 14C212]|uniref:three-helix bundle dimerization domain-containing protein n=1 Tax=Rhodococcus sp. 14C212 TaxID=2711209 RepID=UPI0013EB09BE|nr:hypothetical protein [Rhodococcus sp. 14C212]NGP07370.1 hypothetical protein [Rhodococcus sp. 14C212]
MDTDEERHIDEVRRRLRTRFPQADPGSIDEAIASAHHRLDGRPIRAFVPVLVERAALNALRGTHSDTPDL